MNHENLIMFKNRIKLDSREAEAIYKRSSNLLYKISNFDLDSYLSIYYENIEAKNKFTSNIKLLWNSFIIRLVQKQTESTTVQDEQVKINIKENKLTQNKYQEIMNKK